LNHEGDLFRTRLTHSLEVAQLGRSIARALQLNEDLVEAIALAHDLGHTPFGHAGQDALHECLINLPKDSNDLWHGFEHNLQSLRVVDLLEERYAEFDGLNLCFETREGILKHCSAANARQLQTLEPDGVGQRFIDRGQPSLEAQLCNLADEIAYNAHDVDDGIRSGLISMEQLEDLPLFSRYQYQALSEHAQLSKPANRRRLLYEVIRRMLSAQVYDVIQASRDALALAKPATLQDVRVCESLICFSQEMRRDAVPMKRFLMKNLYRHPQVLEMTERAQQVVRDLFAMYSQQSREMPIGFSIRPDKSRAVSDYIAGMTDRFASKEHQRLTGMSLLP
jgi:dGTPase